MPSSKLALTNSDFVMAGLVPAIHDPAVTHKFVDARNVRLELGPAKPDPSTGHDNLSVWVL
jgi:hypothetical protein